MRVAPRAPGIGAGDEHVGQARRAGGGPHLRIRIPARGLAVPRRGRGGGCGGGGRRGGGGADTIGGGGGALEGAAHLVERAHAARECGGGGVDGGGEKVEIRGSGRGGSGVVRRREIEVMDMTRSKISPTGLKKIIIILLLL